MTQRCVWLRVSEVCVGGSVGREEGEKSRDLQKNAKVDRAVAPTANLWLNEKCGWAGYLRFFLIQDHCTPLLLFFLIYIHCLLNCAACFIILFPLHNYPRLDPCSHHFTMESLKLSQCPAPKLGLSPLQLPAAFKKQPCFPQESS